MDEDFDKVIVKILLKLQGIDNRNNMYNETITDVRKMTKGNPKIINLREIRDF